MMTDVARDGPTCRLLFLDSKDGPNETYPHRVIIYTQNLQGMSGKDNHLESLVYPIVNLIIVSGIIVHFIQKMWLIGNRETMVRRRVVF